MSAEQEQAESTVKWAQSLLHLAAHPDPISQHCAIRASDVEAAARHLASVERENETLHARVAEAKRERLDAINAMAKARRIAEENRGDAMLMRAFIVRDEERGGSGLLNKVHARARKAERERDDERRAHEEIASLCFQHGAEASDGTSLSAVQSLAALLVEAQRNAALLSEMYEKRCADARSLRARAETAERRLAAVTTLVATMEQLASQAYEHWDNDRDAKVGKILGALASYRPGYSLPLDAARQAVTDAEAAAQRGGLKVDGGEKSPLGAVTPKHTVKTLHDDAMAACDAGNFAFAAVLEASALERAVSLRVSPATICILADGLTEIVKRIRHHAARDPIQIPRDFSPSLKVKT